MTQISTFTTLTTSSDLSLPDLLLLQSLLSEWFKSLPYELSSKTKEPSYQLFRKWENASQVIKTLFPSLTSELELLSSQEFQAIVQRAAIQLAKLGAFESLLQLQSVISCCLAQSLLASLEPLAIDKRERLVKKIEFYAKDCLWGLFSRPAKPKELSTTFWCLFCTALESLSFKNEWKTLYLLLREKEYSPLIPLSIDADTAANFKAWALLTIDGQSFKNKRPLEKALLDQLDTFQAITIEGKRFALQLRLKEELLQNASEQPISDQPPKSISELLPDSAIACFINHYKSLRYLQLKNSTEANEATLNALSLILPKLEQLSIQDSASFNLPLSLEQLPWHKAKKLKQLCCHRTHLGHFLANLSSPSKLQTIDVSGSDFSQEQLMAMKAMPQLNSLIANRCLNLSQLAIEMLSERFPNLTRLELSQSRGLHPGAFHDLPSKLEQLDLSWCQSVNDEAIEALLTRELPLHSIQLAYCRSITDLSAEMLGEFPFLNSVDLSHCRQVRADGIDALLTAKTQLKELHLKGQQLFDAQIEKLLNPSLQRLSLPQLENPALLLKQVWPTSLTFLDTGDIKLWPSELLEALLQLPQLKKLRTLRIEAGANLKKSSLPFLEAMQELEELRIWGSLEDPQLFEEGYTPLANLKKLQRLELCYSGNCTVDTLLIDLKKFESLQEVELGPLFQLVSDDLLKLRKELPWLRISCYAYPNIDPF